MTFAAGFSTAAALIADPARARRRPVAVDQGSSAVAAGRRLQDPTPDAV